MVPYHARTQAVLKGIFPVMVGSAVAQWLMLEYKMSKTKKFMDLPPNVVLRKVHSFYWEGGWACCWPTMAHLCT